MKYNKGQLTEEDLKKLQRFWNKEGFFGTPTEKELEKRSNKMQELLYAIKDMTYEEIMAIRHLNKKQLIVRDADRKDLEYALQIAPKTFKVNQSNSI